MDKVSSLDIAALVLEPFQNFPDGSIGKDIQENTNSMQSKSRKGEPYECRVNIKISLVRRRLQRDIFAESGASPWYRWCAFLPLLLLSPLLPHYFFSVSLAASFSWVHYDSLFHFLSFVRFLDSRLNFPGP